MKSKNDVFLPIAIVVAVLVSLFAGTLTSSAKAGPSAYRAIALIQIPGWRSDHCFDIAFAAGHRLYLADASARSVDVLSTTSDTFRGRLGRGAFAGDVGCAQGNYTGLGPDGVLATPTDLYAGDGDGTVKVFNLQSQRLVTTIKTGGKKRADEMAYDPKDHLLAVTSPNETPPFISFINTRTHRVVGHIPFPNALSGLEQPVWDPMTDMFYVSIPSEVFAATPGALIDPGGAIAMVSATSPQQISYRKVPGCEPAGLALDQRTGTLAVGCATGEQAFIAMRGTPGQILARIPESVSGVDMVAYDHITQRFFFAANGCVAVVSNTGRLLQRIPTVAGSHSVAVDPDTGHVFVPESGLGVVVYAETSTLPHS